MFVTYILFSNTIHHYYVGHCHKIKDRLMKHNNGLVKSTKSGKPWAIVHIEIFKSKSEAYRRELQIKSYKGGEAFKRLIKK